MVPDPNDPQSLNRYAYALNNPLRYTDPTGNFSTGCDFCGGGSGLDQNSRFDFGFPDLTAQTSSFHQGSSFNFGPTNYSSQSYSANNHNRAPVYQTDAQTTRFASVFPSWDFGESNLPFVGPSSNPNADRNRFIRLVSTSLTFDESETTRFNDLTIKTNIISQVDLLPINNPENLRVTLDIFDYSRSTSFRLPVEAGNPVDNFGLPGGESLTKVKFSPLGGGPLNPLPNGRNGSFLSFQLDVTQDLSARYFRITPIINQTYGNSKFITPRAVHEIGEGCRACRFGNVTYDQSLPPLAR